MRNWLQNETVILTGASSGIGRELCKILILQYGAKVIGIGRNERKMQTLVAELGESASAFTYRLFDVGEREAWERFASVLQAERISPILLINNAGVFPAFATALDSSVETLNRIINTNFLASVYAVKSLSPLLCGKGKDKPAIVNVASSASLCTIVGTSAYTASKFKIPRQLPKTHRFEWFFVVFYAFFNFTVSKKGGKNGGNL